MKTATIHRLESDDQGTFGELRTDSGLVLCSGELPWRDNAPDRSCIPIGTYTCLWGASVKHGECYHVIDVPGRTAIEIHAANFVGDKSMGFRCDMLGCITLGLSVGTLFCQKSIVSSRIAMMEFEGEMNREPFELKVTDTHK